MSNDIEKEQSEDAHLWVKGISKELENIESPKSLDDFVLGIIPLRTKNKIHKFPRIALAMILVISFGAIWISLVNEEPSIKKPIATILGDMNNDSQINMVDAFLFHKMLQEGKAFEGDLNHDSKTDQLDVNWLVEKSLQARLL